MGESKTAVFRTAALLIFALIAAPPVFAETWVQIGSTDDGTQYFLDTSSVTKDGGLVRSWVKHVPKRTIFDAVFKKSYRYWIEGRAQDCNARSAAMTAAIYRDEKDRNVANYIYPQAEWKFFVVVPGSLGADLVKAACGIAAHQRELKPQILKGSLSQGDWRSLGYDLARSYSVSIKVDSIERTANNVAIFVSKSEFPKGSKLQDGREYHTSVNLQLVDCTNRTFDTEQTEYFSVDGTMIEAAYKTPQEVRAQPINPGTFISATFDIVCAAPVTAKPPATGETPARQTTQQAPEAQSIGFGTGWVSTAGYVVTAYHVIEKAKRISLFRNGEIAGTAVTIATDPVNDIAVLRPNFVISAPAGLALSQSPAPLGSRVFTLGFPQPPSMGMSIKLTAGEISSVAGVDPASGRTDDVRLYQISAPVQSGNSGGPLFSAGGLVVGIISSKLVSFGDNEHAGAPQNVNYAVKARYVDGVLADLPPLRSKAVLVGLGDLETIAKKVQDSVLMIVVE